MAQVISNRPYTVESSIHLTRPVHSNSQKSDANTEKTLITDDVQKRLMNHINLPNSIGPLDYTITCCDDNLVSNVPSPIPVNKKRHDDKILDPITSFISPAGEFYIQSTKINLPFFGKVKLDPQNTIPKATHSIRSYKEAIDEIKYQK
jgi:hypothetical protein